MNSTVTPRHRTPSLIGSDLSSLPYISPFGRLYRLSRLNGLWLHQLPHIFEIPPLLQSMLRTGSGVPWEALHGWDAALSGSDPRFQRTLEDWYPYKNGPDGESVTKLRGCPVCLAYGYHTMLHQLPWISSCPWHRERLVDSCVCGRNLLPRMQGLAKARLLACECGKDHFDRSKALLGMDHWPTNEVLQILTTHLHLAGSARRRTILFSSDTLTLSQAYARIGPAFEMQRSEPFKRMQTRDSQGNEIFVAKAFDESTVETSLRDGIVSFILSRWSQLRHPQGWNFFRFPIIPSCYERIREQAFAVNLEASRKFGICDLVDISENGIYVQRRSIAEDGSEHFRFPRVDGGVVGARLGRLVRELFHVVYRHFGGAGAGYLRSFDLPKAEAALLNWSKTSQARTLALALSEITTLIAIDHLRGLLQIAPSLKNAMRYRLSLGAPIVLVRDKPELKIIVGFSPPKLPSIASVRNVL